MCWDPVFGSYKKIEGRRCTIEEDRACHVCTWYESFVINYILIMYFVEGF